MDAEEQELAARRLFNEAYLQRMGRPQAFGLGRRLPKSHLVPEA